MIDRQDTTVICPKNDLESLTIVDIACNTGLDVRVSNQSWGAKLGREPRENLQNLKKHVLVVEMPDPFEERRLRKAGHHVVAIDHHEYYMDGKRLDRTQSKSSLEQFAEIIGHELTNREFLVALNDKGSFWTLAREANASICGVEEIKQIQEEDLKVQSYTEDDLQRSEEDYGRKIDFNRFSSKCCFSLVSTNLEKVMRIAQLHQQPTNEELKKYRETGDEKQLPVRAILILTLDKENENVREINFFGPWDYHARFSRLLDDHGFKPYDFIIWKGGIPGRSFYWGGKRTSSEWNCNALTDAVLNELVGYDRPLLKFSTIFLYPFKIQAEDEIIPQDQRYWEQVNFDITESTYQEYVYFHQYAREILFPRKAGAENSQERLDPIAYYRFRNDSQAHSIMGELEIEYQEREYQARETIQKRRTLTYPVTHLSIHKFFHNIAILSIQVLKELEPKEERELPFWKLCLKMDRFRSQHLTCQEILLFNELARKTYISFVEQLDEGVVSKIPDTVILRIKDTRFAGDKTPLKHHFCKNQLKLSDDYPHPQANNVVQELLREFLGDVSFMGILDDRMLVHTFWGFAGMKPRGCEAVSEHEALFLRIMYVDQIGDGFACDESFIRKLSDPLIYRRWSTEGSLYGFTRYSSAYTGFGNPLSFFFPDVIFKHFQSIYYQLAVISLYYRSSLIHFSDEVAKTTRHLEKRDRQPFLALRKKFMLFSNVYWFQEVTNLDEGIEIFNLYKESFQFEAMYRQIMEEVERADEFLEIQHRLDMDDLSNNFSLYGLIIGFTAVLAGYFGMNFGIINRLSDRWFCGVTIAMFFFTAVITSWFKRNFLKEQFKKFFKKA
jgi:hypothetical protein